jgi:MFS family permease
MGEKGWFKIHWGWAILFSGFITLFIAYSIRIGAYSVLLPEMIKDLHITKAQAGIIKSAFSMAYLLFAPLMGWLTDRIGGRKVISFFYLFLGGGTFLMGYAESLIASIIFYGIVGLGASATWVPITTLIQRWFGEKKRGLALGILSPSYGIGVGLMGLILPVIVSKYHWRVGWHMLGIAGFMLFFLNGLLLRDKPEKMGLYPWGENVERKKGVTAIPQKMSYLGIIKIRRLWIIGISYFSIAYGTYPIVDFIVTYGSMELKIPYPIASLFLTMIAFGGVIGGFPLNALSDYIGRRKSLRIIQTLVTGAIFFILFAGNHISLLLIGTGFFGLLYGAIWPMYAACVRDYFPEEIAGTILGLLTIFYGVGMMISPVFTGYLADVTGTFRWSFGLGAFISFISALLIGFLKKPIESGKSED